MIKINDERRLLNISHTVIYLMLTSEENTTYGERLRKLNSYASLTRGLFRFETVEKGNAPYEQLPAEMVRATRECNVFVRLINSIHGQCCYGFDCIDLTADMAEVVTQLKGFVEDLCKEDIEQLEMLEPRGTIMSERAKEYYKAHGLFRKVFECAKNLSTDDLDTARQAIKSVTGSDDAATSHELMQGAVDNKYSDKLERERCEIETPMVRPDIRVEVKHVPTGTVTKTGRIRKGLGIEITINGETPIPVYLSHIREGNTQRGGKRLTFLYIALLMAKLEGHHIRRKDFTSNAVPKRQKWLRDKFRIFCFDRTFEEMFGKKNAKKVAELTAEGNKLADTKSKVNYALWKILSEQYKDAYHYLCILNPDERTKNSGYEVRLDKRNIHIPTSFYEF